MILKIIFTYEQVFVKYVGSLLKNYHSLRKNLTYTSSNFHHDTNMDAIISRRTPQVQFAIVSPARALRVIQDYSTCLFVLSGRKIYATTSYKQLKLKVYSLSAWHLLPTQELRGGGVSPNYGEHKRSYISFIRLWANCSIICA